MGVVVALRPVGFALWLIAGVAQLLIEDVGHNARSLAWIAAYALFGVGLVLAAAAPRHARAGLMLQVVTLVAMWLLFPCHFGALLAVVVAWQLAIELPPRAAVFAVVLQTAVVSWCVLRFGRELSVGLAEILALLGLQLFALSAVDLGRREQRARQALAQVHGELLGARALLALSSREAERTRIAREVHDVLGHDLTALGLQLELAEKVPAAAAGLHVGKARQATRRLLADVRAVVGTLRAGDGSDLAAALAVLVTGVPGLTVHLDLAVEGALLDADRVHCVVRCVQEVVTNALRHARADNVWVRVATDGPALVIDARDDGRGAPFFGWGQGLRGMRARIEELGGTLGVDGAAPGFKVRARLPLASAT